MPTFKLPRKPKLLKYPKKPRATASTAVLDRYLDRVKAIDHENKDRMSRYEKGVKEYEQSKKRHADLLKRISGIGSAQDGLKRKSSVSGTRKRAATKAKTKRRSTKRKTAKRRR